MTHKKRTKLFVDKSVQGAIVARVICYWAACVLFMTLPLVLFRFSLEPSVFIVDHLQVVVTTYAPIYGLVTLLLPFAILDSLKLSNRFVGPILRVRSKLQQVNQGAEYSPISLRHSDFWHDLADSLNTLIAAQEQATEPSASETEKRDTVSAS